jgi:tetratricopeptide (TPR) repeat protein
MKLRVLLTATSLLLGSFVATTAMAENNVTITDAARRHFNAGVSYLEDPSGAKYEEAYREFQLAYGESPSYKILNNLGLCALSMERDGEAIDAYERFLAQATESDIPKDKRALMERDVATLKTSLVKITLSSTPAELTLTD